MRSGPTLWILEALSEAPDGFSAGVLKRRIGKSMTYEVLRVTLSNLVALGLAVSGTKMECDCCGSVLTRYQITDLGRYKLRETP